jgi:gas vesicle protein
MNKILIGFTVGVLAGVLLAPAKGSKTRKRIARRGRELKNKFNDMVDSVSDKFESFEEEVDEFAEKAKEKARAYSGEDGKSSWVGEPAIK